MQQSQMQAATQNQVRWDDYDPAGYYCLVLEDNARTPSGVSYVIENR